MASMFIPLGLFYVFLDYLLCFFSIHVFFFIVDVVEMKWLDHNSLTVTEECYTCRCTIIGHKDQIYYWISYDFHKLQPRKQVRPAQVHNNIAMFIDKTQELAIPRVGRPKMLCTGFQSEGYNI